MFSPLSEGAKRDECYVSSPGLGIALTPPQFPDRKHATPNLYSFRRLGFERWHVAIALVSVWSRHEV
jgi:hypothetical protein